jgi:glyoxylase-like metal-dependent hydrolase (beta-lactamase superfamily II)
MSTAPDRTRTTAAAGAAPIVIALPTPFGVGTVNVYLVPTEPLTLVDAGPGTVDALEALEAGLAATGHRIEDLQRIVLTHHHPDHVGLAAYLVRRSGAQVLAFGGIASWLEDYPARHRAECRFIERKLLRHGAPEDVVLVARSADSLVRGFTGGATVDVRLADGDVVPFTDREWDVHHRPGHSTSDLVFHDRARRELVGGDHLNGHVSSNAALAEPLLGAGEQADVAVRLTPLRDYRDSLARTREMDLDVVLPGHGEPVTDHRALIDERSAERERRLDRIVAEVAQGHETGFEIGRAMWGRVALVQHMLVMSELLGHLELLEGDGRVVAHETDGLVRFRVA